MPIEVKIMQMPNGLPPIEAWEAFRQAFELEDDRSMKSVFLAGFTSGMSFILGRTLETMNRTSKAICESATEPPSPVN